MAIWKETMYRARDITKATIRLRPNKTKNPNAYLTSPIQKHIWAKAVPKEVKQGDRPLEEVAQKQYDEALAEWERELDDDFTELMDKIERTHQQGAKDPHPKMASAGTRLIRTYACARR